VCHRRRDWRAVTDEPVRHLLDLRCLCCLPFSGSKNISETPIASFLPVGVAGVDDPPPAAPFGEGESNHCTSFASTNRDRELGCCQASEAEPNERPQHPIPHVEDALPIIAVPTKHRVLGQKKPITKVLVY